MHDMVAGRYKLPWDSSIEVRDGQPCGFAAPTRTFRGPEPNPLDTALPALLPPFTKAA
jgi:formamidase